jgi:Putative serine esterase (DUF676)
MKIKILMLLLAVMSYQLFVPLKAQTTIQINSSSKNYSQIFDSLSTGLIPARVPYGNLYDRVYNWSGLDVWNNGDTSSISKLYQTWYDAEQCVLDSNIRPSRYISMRNLIQRQLIQVKLPLIALNYRFGYIDSNAFIDGRMSINNGFLIDNNNAIPYFTKQISMAGIGLDIVVANKNYSLQFDTSILFNNTTQNIQNIIVTNINSGQTYTVSNSVSPMLIQFTQLGNNVLKFTINLSNGSNFINYQTVKVEDGGIVNGNGTAARPNGPSCEPEHKIVESIIPFRGYIESQATNSFADYHIYYHVVSITGTDNCQVNGQRILRKPIIIMDGFDPNDKNTYHKIYNTQLRYSNSGNLIRLGDELRDKGYDVIILNFPKLGSEIFDNSVPAVKVLDISKDVKVNGTTQISDQDGRDGGTDYMERNAFILVKLIQEVNTTLQANGSTEKLVVIGPSMGGQISRYALAYMEKQQSLGVPNMNHNTRLFLSFDSPNDGANIPVALGYNLNFFGNFAGNQDAKDSYDQELHSVAARQLLIEQKDGLNSSPLFHQIFYSNIRNGGLAGSGGYPINLRKVALINGSGSSIKTYSEGVQVLKMHGTQKTILDGSIVVFSIEDNFMPSTGQSIQIASNLIFRRTPFTIFSGAYPITNNNIRGSMDAVQGSTYDATNAVFVGFEKGLRSQGLGVSLFNLQKLHCFIPTASALGFRNSNFNWNNNIANSNLLCSNQIYFDSYFMPKTNEEHITLTSENVAWLTQEIDKGQQGCPTICTSVIYGRNQLCYGTSNTYYYDFPIPAGSTVIVEPSPNYQFVSQTSNSFTINASGSNSIITFIKVRIVNPCGADVILSKQIMVGYPIPNSDLQVNLVSWPNPVCAGRLQRYEFTCTNDWINQNGILQYSWVVPSNWTIQAGGTPNKFVDLIPYNNAQSVVRFQAKNQCSVTPTDIKGQVISFKTAGCQYGRNFQISPNPANAEITIAAIETGENKNASKNIKEIKILDNLGILKSTNKFSGKNKSEKLYVNTLPIGQYQVSILSDDGLETIPITILK